MGDCPESSKLLSRVSWRLQMAALAKRAFLISCIFAGLYLAAFSFSRGLGLLPDWFHPITVLIVPLAGLLLAVLFQRRPEPVDAARHVDRHTESKDLFLTVSMLPSSAGEYQSLVAQDAEDRAPRIAPTEIVPFSGLREVAISGTTLAALAAIVVLLPQFDPFGNVEAASMVEKAKEELEKSEEATQARKSELVKQDDEGEVSEDVRKALNGLVKSFDEMRRDRQKKNAKVLGDRQREVGAKWRSIRNSDQLKELLNRNADTQNFGRNAQQMKKWGKELEEGNPESLNKQLEELKEALQNLAKTADPAERQALQQEMKRKFKDLADFAREHVKSPQLRAALQRARKQLEAAGSDPELQEQALEAAMESLELAKMELKEIAQSAKELQELEKALETIQKAKQLNSQGELDGELDDEATLDDYAEFYAELMGEGNGNGTGGEGEGGGGEVEEEEDADVGFKNEKSKASIDAGKVLLSIKTKGMSESGEARQQYRNLVREVRQGLSEAIELEQIPPGYVPGIKSYFDSIEESTSDDAGR